MSSGQQDPLPGEPGTTEDLNHVAELRDILGIDVDPDRFSLFVTGGPAQGERMVEIQLVEAGTPLGYAESDAAARFAQPQLDVRVEIGLGRGSATVWTTDLSHEYVSINGDYRT